MFLKSLAIHNDDQLIREISFQKGINLIIDETTSELKTESGNGVGKTTVLRLIDFCLDGKGKNIYLDPEFKIANLKVEEFLKGNNIIITLILIEDIDDDGSRTIEIKRNFLQRSKKIQTINGENYSSDSFSSKLKELFFDTTADKPSFRQLKSKNIRDEKNKLIHTIRVLEPNVTSDATYEALHLFWFGVDVDTSKDKLVRDKNLEERLQTRLRRDSNLSQITQFLVIINKEIETLSKKKEPFNLNEKYEGDLRNLNQIKFQNNANEDLQVIIRDLNAFYEKKGNFEEQKKIWETSNAHLKHINTRLQEINDNIFLKDEIIQKRIWEFNQYFSSISSRLDGVHSLLRADNVDGVYKFRIGNIEGNPGTGTKKSQMASFDLAYIKFADAIGMPCLHFVLQDQIENVHSNQITNLLTEIVDEVNCQYILPVLRDKLPDDIDVSQFEILSLSQNEKLFKV